jgi:hypothetical protein
MSEIIWNIGREGRSWDDDAFERADLFPAKAEMIDGKLLWSDEDRLLAIGLLLENVGIDAVIRLGDPDIWRQAIAELK